MPSASRVYHYIVDTRSLCGRWGLYMGELMGFRLGRRGKEDCATCYRKALERQPRFKELVAKLRRDGEPLRISRQNAARVIAEEAMQ